MKHLKRVNNNLFGMKWFMEHVIIISTKEILWVEDVCTTIFVVNIYGKINSVIDLSRNRYADDTKICHIF